MQLADAANRYIDEQKPWVIAKQDGADATLQSVCTQCLNLFRILAACLQPILPTTALAVAKFLNAPLDRWDQLATPLLAHRIKAYTPLLTRIDPLAIAAMVEASRETLQVIAPTPIVAPKIAAPSVTPAAAVVGTPAAAMIGIDDFSKLDLRIGRVLACDLVEGSDKLLRFQLDAGELGQRQIFSGIRAAYPNPEILVGRQVVFVANLAPRKMRFGISEGMILSAGHSAEQLFLLGVDSGATPGMPVK